MRVLLLQLDGKIPNIALMRIAAHFAGEDVVLRRSLTPLSLEPRLWDGFDQVFASLIFERSRPLAKRLLRIRPDAILGGTGWNLSASLEDHGITTVEQDYAIYPAWRQSIGFTQRGCRLKCPFCVVPRKEGAVREEHSIESLWRGDPWPRELLLLDNDFFGQPSWRDRTREIREGGFKVSFNQGINARMLNEESARAIASVDYRDDGMTRKRIYTAWDNRKDRRRLFAGLELLQGFGVKPSHVMVYMLIGYWHGETDEDWEYRRRELRAFGALPYPMPYRRTRLALGFQRFVVGAYDKRIGWEEWKAADCRPENLGLIDKERADARLDFLGRV